MKAERQQFRAVTAARLVARVAGKDVSPHDVVRAGTNDLSEWIGYFGDADTLYAATGPGEHHLALAHGLYQADGRKLVLVMPKDKHVTAAVCAPWLTPGIELWTYDGNLRVTQESVGKCESLAMFVDPLAGGEVQLGARRTWVEALLTWANEAGLTAAHRRSYFAWHHLGRKVLEIRSKGRRALQIRAGVNYKRPGPERPAPLFVEVEAELTLRELADIRAAVEGAVRRRESGRDSANEEHRLQAWLSVHRQELDLVDIHREFPVYRDGGRAFIDLLGCDATRRLHVVETKIGHDPAIVLQALEYWVWVKAHMDGLETLLRTSRRDPAIQFVVQKSSEQSASALDVYSGALAAALDPSIAWQLRIVSPAGRTYRIQSLPPGTGG